MNAEWPTARFQMEDQPRPPGYRKRSSSKDMIVSDALGNVRPEWVQAVDAAWYNWRFVLAGVLPIAIFFIAALLEFRWLISLPDALAVCGFFASWGIYNVTDVMCDTAVTDDEFGIAACDTGRTFAPFLTVPPLALICTLFALPIGELQLRTFQAFRRWSRSPPVRNEEI